MADEENPHGETLRKKGDQLLVAAMKLRRGGELDAARVTYDNALALFRKLDDEVRIVGTLIRRGDLAQYSGDFEAARADFQAALLLADTSDDGRLAAVCQASLGTLFMECGDEDEAEKHLHAALTTYAQLGNMKGVAAQLGNLAILLQKRGDYVKAAALFEQTAELCISNDAPAHAGNALRALGEIARLTGDLERAEEAFERALVLSLEIKDVLGEAYARRVIGQLRLAAGEVDVATAHLRTAMDLHVQVGEPRSLAAAGMDLGHALLARGLVDEGMEALARALEVAESRGREGDLFAAVALASGSHKVQHGLVDEGIELMNEARAIYDEVRDPHGRASAALNWAGLMLAQGQWETAAGALQGASELARGAGLGSIMPHVALLHANLASFRGDLAGALTHCREAINGFDKVKKGRAAMSARLAQASMLMEMGQVEQIEIDLVALVAKTREHHDRMSEVETLMILALQKRFQHLYHEALDLVNQGIAVLHDLVLPGSMAQALIRRAETRLRMEHWRSADVADVAAVQEDLQEAIALSEGCGFLPRKALALVWLAEAQRRSGDAAGGRRTLEECADLATAMEFSAVLALHDQVAARFAADADADPAAAGFFLEEAWRRFSEMGAAYYLRELREDFPAWQPPALP